MIGKGASARVRLGAEDNRSTLLRQETPDSERGEENREDDGGNSRVEGLAFKLVDALFEVGDPAVFAGDGVAVA